MRKAWTVEDCSDGQLYARETRVKNFIEISTTFGELIESACFTWSNEIIEYTTRAYEH